MASEVLTPIQEFYKNQTLFITGGTGFMGKVLIEKLLRSCPKINKIILLVRPKKGQKGQERLTAMFHDVVFDRINEKQRQKVSVVEGDCAEPDLGLSASDREHLIQNVNIVFHAAATVKFNEELSLAVAINVRATKVILDLGKEMKQLKAFVYVSTAYSSCHLKEVKEKFYPPHISCEDLLCINRSLDSHTLIHITPFLLKNVPNTYVYTKSVAEDYVRTQSKGLPVAVFRPSIIISTKAEPLAGWTDNVYGPTGIMMTTITGLFRTGYCSKKSVCDLVPMDMAVNALIACVYKIQSGSHNLGPEDPTVYNFVSSPNSPVTWGLYFDSCMKHLNPTVEALRYPKLTVHNTVFMHKLDMFWQHLIPALLMDVIARLMFRKARMTKLCWKIENLLKMQSFFSMQQWKFHNDNTVALWDSLHPKDKHIFPFSFKDHDWDTYFKDYMTGVRQYLLKDDLETKDKALAWHKKLYWIYTAVDCITSVAIFGTLFKMVLQPLWRYIFQTVTPDIH